MQYSGIASLRKLNSLTFLYFQILDWLSHSPTDIESYIRPGCIVLTIYLRLPESTWEEVIFFSMKTLEYMITVLFLAMQLISHVLIALFSFAVI